MKLWRYIFGALVTLATDVSVGDEWRTFDIPGGEVQELFKFKLKPNTGVVCKFSYSDLRYEGTWGPSASIVFGEKDDYTKETEGQRFVQLSMAVSEKDNGRVYSILTHGVGEPYRAPFLGLKDKLDTPSFKLDWRDDGVFSYYASEASNGFGAGYLLVPQIKPIVAAVFVSGISGKALCSEYGI